MPLRAPLPLNKITDRYIYECFRRLELAVNKTSLVISAIDRGEAPSGGGTPLPPPDLSNYFYLPGRTGGQFGRGNSATTDPGPGAGLYFQAYDDFVNSNHSLRSSRIEMEKSVTIRTSDFLICERDSTYTRGFKVTTGSNASGGFANTTLYGNITINPASSVDVGLFKIDNTGGPSNPGTLAIIKKRSAQLGNMIEFQDNLGVAMSYIRCSDGAFIGPTFGTGFTAVVDSTFQIVDNIDNSKILMFQVSGVTTATTRTMTVPDASGIWIISNGPAGGQNIGTATPTGGSTDSLSISGQVFLGNDVGSFSYQPHTPLDIRWNVTGSGGGSAILDPGINVVYNDAKTGTALGGAYCLKGVLSMLSNNYNAGSFFMIGIQMNTTPVIKAGVTASELTGMKFVCSISSGGAGTITLISGMRAQIAGGVSWTGATCPAMVGMLAEVCNKSIPVTVLSGVRVSNAPAGSYFSCAEAIAYNIVSSFGASAGVTVWKGLQIPSISGPGTIWGLFISGTMNNQIAGSLALGQAATPAAFLDLGAGTTAIAPIRFQTGVVRTSPGTGDFQWDGSRFWVYDGSTNQKLLYQSDVGAGGLINHNLLSATHTDTTPAAVVRGDIITGQAASPLWKRLALGTNNQVLKSDGTDIVWAAAPTPIITKYVWIPAVIFGENSSNSDKFQSEGTTGASATFLQNDIFADGIDNSMSFNFVIPGDFASLTSWKLYLGTDNTDTGIVTIYFGTKVLTDGLSYLNTYTITSQVWTPPGTANQIKVLTLTDPGVALAAGSPIACFIRRDGTAAAGIDAHTGGVRVIGLLLTYST